MVDADVPPPESLLVPTGVVGVAVGEVELVEDGWVGVPPVPCVAFPEPPNTTAVAPATSNTAVVTAPTSVFRRGPPAPAGPMSPASSAPSSSPEPSTPADAISAGT